MKAWSGEAGQIVLGKVDDAHRSRSTRRGPGRRSRGRWRAAAPGAFGGKTINGVSVWLGFCAALLRRARRLRRPLCAAEPRPARAALVLDLAALLQRGRDLLERAARLPAARLPARPLPLDRAPRPPLRVPRPSVWPVWLLAAAALFLVGFRVGLNVEAPAQRDRRRLRRRRRRAADRERRGAVRPHAGAGEPEALRACRRRGRDPRAHPDERPLRSLEPARRHVRAGLLPRVPARVRRLRLDGEVGRALGGARDVAALRRRLRSSVSRSSGGASGGRRLAATLAFAWAAYPFTLYVSNSNTNDAIMPAFLIWGFWLASSAWARGAAVALAGWTKFAALLLAPLWLSYPGGLRAPAAPLRARVRRRHARRVPILLLEPDPLHAARVFAERTLGFQLDRESPFSLWGWGQYHAKRAFPTCTSCSRCCRCSSSRAPPLARVRAAAEVDRSSSPRSPPPC